MGTEKLIFIGLLVALLALTLIEIRTGLDELSEELVGVGSGPSEVADLASVAACFDILPTFDRGVGLSPSPVSTGAGDDVPTTGEGVAAAGVGDDAGFAWGWPFGLNVGPVFGNSMSIGTEGVDAIKEAKGYSESDGEEASGVPAPVPAFGDGSFADVPGLGEVDGVFAPEFGDGAVADVLGLGAGEYTAEEVDGVACGAEGAVIGGDAGAEAGEVAGAEAGEIAGAEAGEIAGAEAGELAGAEAGEIADALAEDPAGLLDATAAAAAVCRVDDEPVGGVIADIEAPEGVDTAAAAEGMPALLLDIISDASPVADIDIWLMAEAVGPEGSPADEVCDI